jgi:hypothetical protein
MTLITTNLFDFTVVFVIMFFLRIKHLKILTQKYYKKGRQMVKINVAEESDFEGKKIIINNLNVLPIFTKNWFDRIESFVKQDFEKYSVFKLLPEHTNCKDVLEQHDAYVFIVQGDNKTYLYDIGGVFPVNADFVNFLEHIPTV